MKINSIDLEQLRKISGNSESFVSEILKLYADRTARDIHELNRAAQITDWMAVSFIAHRMRSSSIPLGLKDLLVDLKKLELKIKSGNYIGLDQDIRMIIALAQNAVAEVQSIIKLESA